MSVSVVLREVRRGEDVGYVFVTIDINCLYVCIIHSLYTFYT